MMDDRKSLMNYIGPGPWLALVCVLLLAATLLCTFYTPPVVEVEPTYPPAIPSDAPSLGEGEEENALVYLTTIAISDAIYQSPDGKLYYAAEENTHYFRIVCVSGETYALMDRQRALWNDPDSFVSQFRLTGRRMLIPDEVKAGFLSVFSMDEEIFDLNFGRFCLVEEPAIVAPEAGRAPAWTVCAVLFAVAFLITLLIWLFRFLASWSALVRLEETERLGDAAQQIDDPSGKEERGGKLRLTGDFLFGSRIGLASEWKDVVWSYERSLSLGSFILARLLVIRTADGKAHPLFFSAQETKDLRRLANRLCERNPKMLWDLTEENRAAWREMTA